MYVKLFSSIFDSSVWVLPTDARIVWITLLGMADRDGFVFASPFMISRRANISLPSVEMALALFLAPDPNSQSKEHDGRRLTQTPDGYYVLNYRKYRELRSAEERRMQQNEWMAAKRREEKAKMSTVDKSRHTVDKSRPTTYSEAPSPSEATLGEPSLPNSSGVETVSARPKKVRAKKPGLYDDPIFGEFWAAYPLRVGKKKAWLVWLELNEADRALAAKGAAEYAAAYKNATPDRKQFIQHPTTWLNARGFEDDREAWYVKAGTTPPPKKPKRDFAKEIRDLEAVIERMVGEMRQNERECAEMEFAGTLTEQGRANYAMFKENDIDRIRQTRGELEALKQEAARG